MFSWCENSYFVIGYLACGDSYIMVLGSCGDWLFSWHGDKYIADVGDRDLTV